MNYWYGAESIPPTPKRPPRRWTAFFNFLDEQLPKTVQEDENITQGRQVDPHLSPVHAAALQMVQGRVKVTLQECLEQYVEMRPATDKDARMVFGYLFAFLGTRSPVLGKDRDLRSVRRQDVREFIKWLLAGRHRKEGKPVSTTTVSRYLTNIRAAFAMAIKVRELLVQNVFAEVEIPRAGRDAVKRETFTLDQYRYLHQALDAWSAERGPDQLRCILALVAETGARLGEIVRLAAADVHLRASVPYLDLREQPWRSLKTLGSARKVPLTPKALEAAKVALRLADHSPFLFPAYTTEDKCRADSASASLVKWGRTREGLTGTKLGNHSLRHGMEDLLRAVGCPDSARDQITGHKTPGMGANYGEGYPMAQLAEWVTKAVGLVHA